MSSITGLSFIANYFISLVIFLFVWAFYLGGQIAYWGEQAVVTNGLTGLEAFLFSNMNLLLGAVILLVTIIVIKFSDVMA